MRLPSSSSISIKSGCSTHKLSGAAEARRAHNPEGNGSKPFSAITFVFVFFFSSIKTTSQLSFFLTSACESQLDAHRSHASVFPLATNTHKNV